MIRIEEWNEFSDHTKGCLVDNAGSLCGLDLGDTNKLANSLNLLSAFFQIAHEVAEKRDHYSAYIIVQVLRHNSLISDNDDEYKINNNITPLVARVATQLFPALNGLFRLKPLKKEVNHG